MTVFACFIEGQGGLATSPGMAQMAHAAEQAGIAANVFAYEQLAQVQASIIAQRKAGHKIALIGYSAGVGTAGAAQRGLPVDLVIGLDPSRDCINYRLGPNTKRSILFHNHNWLSRLIGVGAGGEAGDPGGDLGFQVKYEIDENHLAVDLDPKIHAVVQAELLKLKQEK